MLLSCVSLKVAKIFVTFADLTGYVYYLESGGGGYSLVSASPPRGQESGLISARHQTRLSLHTHPGREVRLGSERKPVNLIQM